MSVRQRGVPAARRYAVVAALALTLTGCGDGGTSDGSAARPEAPTPTSPASPSGPASAGAPSSTPGSTPGSTPATPAATGSADDPVRVRPTPEVLDWSPVPGSARDTVTRGAGWTLTVAGDGSAWRLRGPQGASHGGGATGRRVSDALLDEHWAVVVLQDRHEARPSTAQVVDLRTGASSTIDGRSDQPTTGGGSWALAGDRLLHATYGPGRSYCVATVDLTGGQGGRAELGWCAPPRHGFTGAHVGTGGDSVLSFDAGRPSCRTLLALDGAHGTPFPGVPDCTAWDGLLTPDGAVWSVVTDPHRVEQAHFYARSGERWLDLGSGTSGSLVWCGDAAWFARDPARDGAPAQLLRWSPVDGLSTAYRSHGGHAFLSAPRCGGDTVTVTAFTDAGDEQVSAPAA